MTFPRLRTFFWKRARRIDRWLIRKQANRVAAWTLELTKSEDQCRELEGYAEQSAFADFVLQRARRNLEKGRRDLVRAKRRLQKMEETYVRFFISPNFKGRSHQMRINGHITRISDASTYDEICVKCGAHDWTGTLGALRRPCLVSDEEYERRQAEAKGVPGKGLENK